MKFYINNRLAILEDMHVNTRDYPDFCDSYIISARWDDGDYLTEAELEQIDSHTIYELCERWIY